MADVQSGPRVPAMLGYFYPPPTCSMTRVVALKATSADDEPVPIDLADDRNSYRVIIASGRVPALQADGRVVADAISIVYRLAKRYRLAALLRTDDDLVANALAVIAWLESVMHALRSRLTRPAMFCDGAAAKAAVHGAAAPRHGAKLKRTDGWIGEEPLGARATSFGDEGYALLLYHRGLHAWQPMTELVNFATTPKRLSKREDVGWALTHHNIRIIKRRA